ncbi:probable protein kinase UbiB isoform X1 [Mangifera indica]|uniref:probable protein kinase UbiB isoform X1 n=1 Tax=Mangifera indica TaxID=29780 RepID=UPI001CF973D1|nr:probable protein kinase UbiB isoform X1 [Mangifera indica]
MAWGNIYRRRMKVLKMALKIFLDYKGVQVKEKWTKKSERAELWEKAHKRNARSVVNLMVELSGLWVKIGQYLSARADVLPAEYISQLKKLQDSLPPRPLLEVRQTIEKELGKSIDDVFMDFVRTPLATASIAQVHRAKLIDGRDVVVKVQHPGIKTIFLEDLKDVKYIVDWIAWADPVYNFKPVLDEWCREAPKELDFKLEEENTRTVYANLCCKNRCEDNKSANRVDVLVPKVIQSTESVLMLEYMDGIRLNDSESLEASGVDKRKIVEEITRAYAHQIFVDGFFNGDPHPGNFLVSKEAPHRPILLDFGLTKKLSNSVKQALAKFLLACAEGDHVALLSAMAEMGLKLRLDMPEQAMEVTTLFFRESTPADESHKTREAITQEKAKSMKHIQEKMQFTEKEIKRFDPFDAFPGDFVMFSKVLTLLRGLSSMMNVRIVYLDIMRPFAESVLEGNMNKGPATNPQWIYDSPTHSEVEAKLREFLVQLGNEDKILGIQVCAYKDGKVIIDTAAGVLGRYDPRPVQPDSLFNVLSVTKGITAGLLHWLVDKGKLKLEDNVADIWPEFGSNGKDLIKVHHVLNHTSGLHNALDEMGQENPIQFTDWDVCLSKIAALEPQSKPGQKQVYHYLSFGWLCGAIIERASGKKFQEILEEIFVRPLNIEGELYVGIPPGVESRLPTLSIDEYDRVKYSDTSYYSALPPEFQHDKVAEIVTSLPVFFNILCVRRAVIPSCNLHCSARAVARYYATLADGGEIPPPHSSLSNPPLGSHPHIPKFPSQEKSKKPNGKKNKDVPSPSEDNTNNKAKDASGDASTGPINMGGKIFNNPRIHDAFLGVGEYGHLALPNGQFGLGFKRNKAADGSIIGFGHSGMGGSTGFCDIKNRFAIAVSLNKMSYGATTARIMELVCSELNIPLPVEYSKVKDFDRPLTR